MVVQRGRFVQLDAVQGVCVHMRLCMCVSFVCVVREVSARTASAKK